MLVLSRKPGQQIVIGDNIIVTITEIVGGKVRVGIEADKSVSVMRKELYDERKRTDDKVEP